MTRQLVVKPDLLVNDFIEVDDDFFPEKFFFNEKSFKERLKHYKKRIHVEFTLTHCELAVFKTISSKTRVNPHFISVFFRNVDYIANQTRFSERQVREAIHSLLRQGALACAGQAKEGKFGKHARILIPFDILANHTHLIHHSLQTLKASGKVDLFYQNIKLPIIIFSTFNKRLTYSLKSKYKHTKTLWRTANEAYEATVLHNQRVFMLIRYNYWPKISCFLAVFRKLKADKDVVMTFTEFIDVVELFYNLIFRQKPERKLDKYDLKLLLTELYKYKDTLETNTVDFFVQPKSFLLKFNFNKTETVSKIKRNIEFKAEEVRFAEETSQNIILIHDKIRKDKLTQSFKLEVAKTTARLEVIKKIIASEEAKAREAKWEKEKNEYSGDAKSILQALGISLTVKNINGQAKDLSEEETPPSKPICMPKGDIEIIDEIDDNGKKYKAYIFKQSENIEKTNHIAEEFKKKESRFRKAKNQRIHSTGAYAKYPHPRSYYLKQAEELFWDNLEMLKKQRQLYLGKPDSDFADET